MSDDIANILKRLAIIESDITPVSVKKGLNQQQKSVPQLPALFRPENISPVLGSNNQKKPLGKNMVGDSVQPVRNALAERMAEIDEDMLSRVKKDLTQYLDKLEQKAKQEIQDKNPAKPDDQDDYEEDAQEESQEPMMSGTAMMSPVSVAEYGPVKIITLEDGTCLECWGDQSRGFEIRHGGRILPSRFGNLDEAEMAVEMYQAHRRGLLQDPSQDYLEEA
jgi:hypothetical protein